MATEQATTPNNERKCTCNKQIAELKNEIEILRLVLRSVKQMLDKTIFAPLWLNKLS